MSASARSGDKAPTTMTPPTNIEEDTNRAIGGGDNGNIASIRQVHKIGPASTNIVNGGDEDHLENPAKKAKKSGIKIFARPLPGRSFDGFLGRLVKSTQAKDVVE